MLNTIANYKQNNTADDEKIQVNVDILNKLTENSKYSFESWLIRQNQNETTGDFEKQSQNQKALHPEKNSSFQILEFHSTDQNTNSSSYRHGS